MVTRLLRSGDKLSHSQTPNIPRFVMTYPSLGPVSIDSLRLPNTSSIGRSISSCMPASDSQSAEDNGLMESIDVSASCRRLIASGPKISACSLSSTCKAAEATSGVTVHALAISARFSAESAPAIAREKCTIPQPRAIENAQAPMIAIAVQNRIVARIATRLIFREVLLGSQQLCCRRPASTGLLIAEH